MNTNYDSSLSYKGLILAGGAADTLKRVIKPEHAEDFKAVMNSLKNSSADTSLFGRYGSTKKLDARVSSPDMNIKDKECSQRLFESPMHFLKRVLKKSVAMDSEIRSAKNFDMDEFLKSIK